MKNEQNDCRYDGNELGPLVMTRKDAEDLFAETPEEVAAAKKRVEEFLKSLKDNLG